MNLVEPLLFGHQQHSPNAPGAFLADTLPQMNENSIELQGNMIYSTRTQTGIILVHCPSK